MEKPVEMPLVQRLAARLRMDRMEAFSRMNNSSAEKPWR
jgi:hypothetical protein